MRMTSHSPTPAAPPSTSWPGSLSPGNWARWAAYLLTVLGLAIAAYRFAEAWPRIPDVQPVEVHLWATMPEAGGWQGNTLSIPSGRQAHLIVHGVSGVHTFALAHTDIRSSRSIHPGDQEVTTFVAPEPGRYVLYCTTWCSPNHWRMRTVVEVYDPADEDAMLTYTQLQARYTVDIAPEALDKPHLGDIWPAAQPDAARGAAYWIQSAPDPSPHTVLAALDWPNVTPAEAYARLRNDDGPAFGAKADGAASGTKSVQIDLESDDEEADEVWAMVAYLWQQATSPQEIALGETLYQENCVACHGDQGRGDGFAAATSVGQEPDFTDLRAAAGASPALYYAKTARGGMGTGMPNWGTVLAEDELWALVAYIQSFSYTSSDTASNTSSSYIPISNMPAPDWPTQHKE